MEWTKEKVSRISDGKTEVRFTLNGFTICADPMGVRFTGTSDHISELTDLDVFAKKVSQAWGDYQKLKPKIVAPYQ